MGIEFIHTATLVHDDLIDKAPTRRGITTIHEALGPDPAVIIGDYYFAKGAYLLAEIGMPAIDSAISHAVMTICMGELLQMTSRNEYDQSLADYHRKIGRKTATLVSTSCYGGGLIAGLDADVGREPAPLRPQPRHGLPDRRRRPRLRRHQRRGGQTGRRRPSPGDGDTAADAGAQRPRGRRTPPRRILAKDDLNEEDFDTVVSLVRGSDAIAEAERSAQEFAREAAAELTGVSAVDRSRNPRAGLRLRRRAPDLSCAHARVASPGQSAPSRRTSAPKARAHARQDNRGGNVAQASTTVAGIDVEIAVSPDCAAMSARDGARDIDRGEQTHDDQRACGRFGTRGADPHEAG